MVQKRVSGISLREYLQPMWDKGESPTEAFCHRIYVKVVAQQDGIGFNHGDVQAANIMVNASTGDFQTLIDWDAASVRIPENKEFYAYKYATGNFKRECPFS
jgi:hypothetical protein